MKKEIIKDVSYIVDKVGSGGEKELCERVTRALKLGNEALDRSAAENKNLEFESRFGLKNKN